MLLPFALSFPVLLVVVVSRMTRRTESQLEKPARANGRNGDGLPAGLPARLRGPVLQIIAEFQDPVRLRAERHHDALRACRDGERGRAASAWGGRIGYCGIGRRQENNGNGAGAVQAASLVACGPGKATSKMAT